jgi:hypothetical protein
MHINTMQILYPSLLTHKNIRIPSQNKLCPPPLIFRFFEAWPLRRARRSTSVLRSSTSTTRSWTSTFEQDIDLCCTRGGGTGVGERGPPPDKCAEKVPLMLMGGQAEVARTPIGIDSLIFNLQHDLATLCEAYGMYIINLDHS